MTLDMQQARQAVDAIDVLLVEKLMQRMDITHRIGEYKRQNGIDVLDTQREQQLLKQRVALVQSGTNQAIVEVFFQCLLAISRCEQQGLIQGEQSKDALRKAICRALDEDV